MASGKGTRTEGKYRIEWEEPHYGRIKDAEGHTLATIQTDDAVIAEDHIAEVGRINAFVKAANRAPALLAENAALREFISKWKDIIDGGSKSAEGWAVEFDAEARAALALAVKP